MNRSAKLSVLALLLAIASAAVLSSHPHFRKSVIAKLPGLEIKLDYTTLPWNPAHLSEVKDGFIFSCGFASVELDKAAKQGAKEIPAGKYQLRARAKDLDHWTFLLIPAPPDRDTKPDMTKAIELATRTLTGRPVNHHLALDVSAGHGDTDNKAIFILSWGDRQIEGAVADF